jgi:secreted Zn-dependent insulinase-like peptidase
MEEFENLMLQPCMLASDTRQVMLIDRMWGVTCQYNVYKSISLERFIEVVEMFKARLHTRVYVAGNINRTGAYEVMDLLINGLKYRPVSHLEFPKTRINQLPVGEKCIRIRSFSLEGDTSVIKNVYQVGVADARTRVICDYILEIISEPMFNTLRTEKQLSYNPEMIFHDDFGVMQLQIHLITQADKFGPEFINKEIDEFLEKFYHEEIDTLTEQKMKVLRREMIQSKRIYLESPMESEVVWEKVVTEDVDFYFLEHQIEAWKSLKAKDVKDFFKKYLLNPSFVHKHYPDFVNEHQGWHFRKLSIQIVGYNENERKRKRKLNEPNDYSRLQYLNWDRNNDYFVGNIMDFKQTLLSYPGRF